MNDGPTAPEVPFPPGGPLQTASDLKDEASGCPMRQVPASPRWSPPTDPEGAETEAVLLSGLVFHVDSLAFDEEAPAWTSEKLAQIPLGAVSGVSTTPYPLSLVHHFTVPNTGPNLVCSIADSLATSAGRCLPCHWAAMNG